MSLRLTVIPARPEQLARVSADPAAFGPVLDPQADPDGRRLRHGPRVLLRAVWPAVHALLTRGDSDQTQPALGFLIRGGAPLGDRVRAFRSAEVSTVADAVRGVHTELDGRFAAAETQASGVWFNAAGEPRAEVGLPVVRERLAEVQALLGTAVDERLGLLVVRRADEGEAGEPETTVTLHVATDAAIDRYQADPALLEAQLEGAPTAPIGAAVIRGWFALHVALTELGDSDAHRFVAEGGTLVDEALQLRVFSPEEVEALAALTAALDPETLLRALSPEVLDRDGLERDEAESLAEDYPALRQGLVAWSAQHLGLATLLV